MTNILQVEIDWERAKSLMIAATLWLASSANRPWRSTHKSANSSRDDKDRFRSWSIVCSCPRCYVHYIRTRTWTVSHIIMRHHACVNASSRRSRWFDLSRTSGQHRREPFWLIYRVLLFAPRGCRRCYTVLKSQWFRSGKTRRHRFTADKQ